MITPQPGAPALDTTETRRCPASPRDRKRYAHRHAQQFRVWRAAKHLDWQCSALDLAAETGIDITTIKRMVSRLGWPIRKAVETRTEVFDQTEAQPVDFVMARPALAMDHYNHAD